MAAASTVWEDLVPLVLPLTAAMPAIHGARVCAEHRRYPLDGWLQMADRR